MGIWYFAHRFKYSSNNFLLTYNRLPSITVNVLLGLFSISLTFVSPHPVYSHTSLIKYKDLPELNDELIKKLKIENVETVDAYKEKVKTDLTAQKEREAEENFTNELLGKVCDNANVEIPAVMIDAEVDRMYKEFEGRMQQSGFTAKQFLEATHQTEEAIRAQMSPEAAARVKTQLVLEAIVKAESIEASDEDVEKEFTTMSEMYNMEVEKIKSLISPESIKADLANQKALDFIKTSVK